MPLARSTPVRMLLALTALVLVIGLATVPDAIAGETESSVAMGDSYTAGPGIPNPILDPLLAVRPQPRPPCGSGAGMVAPGRKLQWRHHGGLRRGASLLAL